MIFMKGIGSCVIPDTGKVEPCIVLGSSPIWPHVDAVMSVISFLASFTSLQDRR